MSNTANQKKRRAERTREFLSRLSERFPGAFTPRRKDVRPLAIGIQEKLKTALEQDADLAGTPNWLIKQALARYTHAPSYLEAIVAGHNRVDLDGSDAGPVTDDARQHARGRREEQKKAASARRAKSGRPQRPAKAKQATPSSGKLEKLAEKFNSESGQ